MPAAGSAAGPYVLVLAARNKTGTARGGSGPDQRCRRSMTERSSKRVPMSVTGAPGTRSISSMNKIVSGWSWS